MHRASDRDRANVKGDMPTVATRIGKALLEEKQGSEIFVPRKCRDAISPAAGFNPDATGHRLFRIATATRHIIYGHRLGAILSEQCEWILFRT